MKIKSWKKFNEDSFEGRRMPSEIVSVEQIEKVVQETIDGYADEGVYDFRVDEYGQIEIKVFVTMKAINHFNISEDDEEWEQDMNGLAMRIRHSLEKIGLFVNIESLNAITLELNTQN
jgi:hypothetical protein